MTVERPDNATFVKIQMRRTYHLQQVVVPKMTNICKDCGCHCDGCYGDNSLDLHQQIEELHSQVRQSNNRISQVEREWMRGKSEAEYEILKMHDELAKLRDRYDRLFESHKRLQRVNHSLEDKLLKVVNKFEAEKVTLQKDMASITSKIVDSRVLIRELEEENDRYRNDCNLAVQMLQCKPSNFVAHKLNSLPLDLQERVKSHLTREQIINMENVPLLKETKLIRVPIQTFPPTAMFYSINDYYKNDNLREMDSDMDSQSVPMTLIAKVLAQPETNRKPRHIYICEKCKQDVIVMDKAVQTCREYAHMGMTNGTAVTMKVHTVGSRSRQNSTETEI